MGEEKLFTREEAEAILKRDREEFRKSKNA